MRGGIEGRERTDALPDYAGSAIRASHIFLKAGRDGILPATRSPPGIRRSASGATGRSAGIRRGWVGDSKAVCTMWLCWQGAPQAVQRATRFSAQMQWRPGLRGSCRRLPGDVQDSSAGLRRGHGQKGHWSISAASAGVWGPIAPPRVRAMWLVSIATRSDVRSPST